MDWIENDDHSLGSSMASSILILAHVDVSLHSWWISFRSLFPSTNIYEVPPLCQTLGSVLSYEQEYVSITALESLVGKEHPG